MSATLKKHLPDPIKRAARALGYALMIHSADGWHGFTVVLAARLSTDQRAALAWSALRSLPPHIASETAYTAIHPAPEYEEAA